MENGIVGIRKSPNTMFGHIQSYVTGDDSPFTIPPLDRARGKFKDIQIYEKNETIIFLINNKEMFTGTRSKSS